MRAIDTELIARLRNIRAANASDALERRGLRGGCEGLHPVWAGSRMVGPAYTVRYIPTGSVQGNIGDYIDEIPAGYVAVLDNAGRSDRSVWGYCLTRVARRKEIAGTVIDGMCRDVPVILAEQYTVFARGTCVMTGKGHYMLQAVQVPVSIGGIQVNPDDLIVADDSGVVVVPAGVAPQIVQDAEGIQRAEEACVEEFYRGTPLRRARELHGYHTLQSSAELPVDRPSPFTTKGA